MDRLLRWLVDPEIDTGNVHLFLDDAAGGWFYAIVILLAAGFCVASYLRIRTPIRRKYRLLMIGARLAMLVAVLVLLLRPTLAYSRLATPVVAILVDTSASMDRTDVEVGEAYHEAATELTGEPSPTRISIAAAAATRVAEVLETATQPQPFETRVYGFDRSLGEAGPVPTSARGARTDLEGALEALGQRTRGQPLLAVVLLGDGVGNAGGDPVEALRYLGGGRVPLYTIGLGGVRERPDLRLTRVDCPAFAFLLSTWNVEASLRWVDLEGEAEVRVFEGEEEIAHQTVSLLPSEGSARVSFDLPAASAGRHFYRLEVEPLKGEATTVNNVRHFSVDVLETLRVLYLTATPRSEFAFLRRYLETDCRIGVTVLLAAPGQQGRFLNRSTQARDQHLESIPETEEEIGLYQVVVFGDIERSRLTGRQMDLIARHVEQGAGFLMLGGEHTFGSGGYAGSKIADLLPVEIDPEEEQIADRFVPEITEQGYRSTFFQSSVLGSVDDFSWEDLPLFGGLNAVGKAKPGARVLAVHPTLSGPSGRRIVIAASRYGRGRTMAMAVDETWRWWFERAYEDPNPAGRVYQDFWGQVVRWLGIPPERPGLAIRLAAKDVPMGATSRIQVQLLDRNRQPIPDVVPELAYRVGEDGELRPLSLVAEEPERGVFVVRWDTGRTGEFRLVARATDERGEALSEEEILFVRPSIAEIERTRRDAAMLASLGSSSGGAYTEIYGAEGVARLIADIPYEKDGRFRQSGESPLWDAWSVLVLLVALVALEWNWRRKAGLV